MHRTHTQTANVKPADKRPQELQQLDLERELRFTRGLLTFGIIAPVVTVTVIAVMAARTPGYRHVRDTVSDLAAQGVADAGIVMAAIFTIGIMVDLFAYGLLRAIDRNGVLIWASLTVFGTSGALSGLAQDYSEEPGVPRNLEGFLHNTFTLIAVIGLISAMLLLAWMAPRMPGWQRMTKWSLVTAIGVTSFGLIFLAAPESVQGLVQRCIYFFAITWFVLTASTALRTTIPPPDDLRSF
jgi:hypothetical membrane protein